MKRSYISVFFAFFFGFDIGLMITEYGVYLVSIWKAGFGCRDPNKHLDLNMNQKLRSQVRVPPGAGPCCLSYCSKIYKKKTDGSLLLQG